MSVYQQLLLGVNLSQFATSIEAQHEAIRSQERGTTEPTIQTAGLQWSSTNTTILNNLTGGQIGGPWPEAIVRWSGSAWVLVHDPRYPALNAGGTVKMAAQLPMNGNQIVGLGAGSSPGHVPRMDQCLLRDGSFAMTANLNAGGFKIVGLADPTSDGHAATKAYVDANTGAPDTGTVTASGSQQTVTLGYQPSAVAVAFNSVDVGSVPNQDPGRRSGAALFSAGTGTESGEVITRLANAASAGLHEFTIEVEYTATGFKVRVTHGTVSQFAGTLRYAAWR